MGCLVQGLGFRSLGVWVRAWGVGSRAYLGLVLGLGV